MIRRAWIRKKARRRRELWRTGRVMEDAAGMAVLREAAFRRDKGLCVECGKYFGWDVGELMHTVARGKGGSDTLDNVSWGCRDCHKKRDHPGPQWSKNETSAESRCEP